MKVKRPYDFGYEYRGFFNRRIYLAYLCYTEQAFNKKNKKNVSRRRNTRIS